MLNDLKIAIVVEAWMSNNIDLLYKSIGKKKDEKADKYDQIENLRARHEFFPQCSVYLSMLSFKQDWKEILPRFSEPDIALSSSVYGDSKCLGL